MNKKFLLYILLCIVSISIVYAESYNFSSVYGEDYCYQETANVSTSCGGLATGNYNWSGNWSGSFVAYNVFDGNWSTGGRGESGFGYLYINYSLMSNYNSSYPIYWQIKKYISGTLTTVNQSVPSACIGGYASKIGFYLKSEFDTSSGVYAYCYNGTSWIELTDLRYVLGGGGTQYALIYEEGIYQYVLTNHSKQVNYSISSSSGVFGETSNIILNLTKGTNQSYSNTKLIYNGVVYSSPTQTDYSDYVLFTQSVSNLASGNFSYFWNVSLTDFGNQFNFTTVNSSHVVTGLQGNLVFYDEITKSLLSSRNISLGVIGSLFANNYSTSTGYLNVSNLSSGSYVFRYKSLPEYAERFYLVDVSGNFSLSLYLINGSTQITLTVKDQNDNTLSNAVIKVQRYDLSTNSYTTREIVSTNTQGLAYFEGLLNSEFYKFIVEYPFGTQVLETTPDYLRSNALTLRVNLEAISYSDYFASLNTYGKVTFNNNTNNFNFDYNGISVTQGCLYVYDDDLDTTLLNTSCINSSASSILLGVVNETGKTYTATGTVFISGTEYLLDTESFSFPKTPALSTDNKKIFLLFTLLLTMVIGFLTLWNISVFLMLTPLPLFVMSLIQLIPISRPVGITIYLVAITLAILVVKRS